jgi:capsular exopolysaccharide synthesis family protein
MRNINSRILPGIELRQFIGILSRQFKLLLGILLLVVFIAVAILTQLERRFTADALLVIDERESQLVGLDETAAVGATLNDRVNTEAEILKSSSVTLSVINRLNLWNDEEFGGRSLLQKLLAVAGLNFDASKGLEQVTPAELVDNLRKRIKVTRLGLTSAISVSVTSRSPQKAAKIANALTEAYLDSQIETMMRTAQRAANFLQQRVDELASSIQTVDDRMDAFIVDQSQKVGTPEARAELARMRGEMQQIATTQAELATRISKLRQIRGTGGKPLAEGLPSADQYQFATERERLSRELANSRNQEDVGTQHQALDAQIRQTVDRQLTRTQLELAGADTQVEELRKNIQDLFLRQQIPSEVAVDLYRLQREAETNRKLYDSYSERLGEVQQKANLALPNSRIIATAIVPYEASFPPTILIMGLAVIIGLGLGAGAATIRELLVGGFASREQIEALTNLPVAAVVPRYTREEAQNAILREPFSAFSEAIRRMRIGIEDMIGTAKSKIVVVTSTEPNEGKSTLSVSLARALAASGHKTLLVDCDLRRPSILQLTGVSSPRELVELLKSDNTVSIERAVGREDSSGLYVLNTAPSGKHMGDVLFSSREFEQLLSNAREIFNYVVVDSPPVGYVVDAKIISRFADLNIYVVKYNATSQNETLNGVREMLNTAGAPPIAIVLNGSQRLFGDYSYGSHGYGQYGYHKT